ncbi:MAG: ATP-dependent DNA helicase [Bacillota bacterium]
MASKTIKISVRDLIENTMRSGSINSVFMCSNKAIQGIRAHQKLQKGFKDDLPDGAELFTEYAFDHVLNYNGFDFHIDGRIDGIVRNLDMTIIKEIKSTNLALDEISVDSSHPHYAQAACYAYIYCAQNSIDSAVVQLIYYQLDRDETRVVEWECSFSMLEEYFFKLLNKLVSWLVLSREWTQCRDLTIKRLDFPFEQYRKGQRDFAVAVYKTIKEGKRIYIQAPTGTGKTISVLFPSIKAVGEGLAEKIFYLTARTTHKQIAVDTVKTMISRGLAFKCLVITAKEKICPKEKTICDADYCEYARGYYDRIEQAVRDVFINEDIIDKSVLCKYSEKHTVCPFELSLDISLWVDCIISDYNYVFDPRVYLKRFFAEKNKSEYIILVDEAHNLVERARDMYSAEVSKREILSLKKDLGSTGKKSSIVKLLGSINSELIKYRRLCLDSGFCSMSEPPRELYPVLRELIVEAELWLSQNYYDSRYDSVLGLYFKINNFVKISELYDERYVTYVSNADRDTVLRLFCVDPSFLIREVITKQKSAVFFSATLSPIGYYRELLGGLEEDYIKRMSSPFDSENFGIYIRGISTKYKKRELTTGDVADCIYAAATSRNGNYLAFFPSYKYLRDVHSIFIVKYPEINTVIQNSSMDEAQREQFIESFKNQTVETYLGFAVLGGLFSEGIDLTGDRLLGAVVVGVGLPQICPERDIIMEYFNNHNNKGYEYSYVFPGINKVLQSAGRVIRSAQDKGFVVLIDERYQTDAYRKLFPGEWSGNVFINSAAELSSTLASFWNNCK